MIKYLSICCLLVIAVSCKSTALFQQEQNTKQHITLGHIGINKDYILEQNYHNTAIPRLEKPIKLQVTVLPFSKKTYQAFRNAKKSQGNTIAIMLSDSLEGTQYVQLKIADQVALVSILNSKSNLNVKEYMQTQSDASIVTQIALALHETDLKAMVEAESCFLIETASKSYGLGLYKNGKRIKVIHFNEAVVFNYRVSNACWQTNNHLNVHISSLVNQNQSCPNKTYSSANRAERRINYFKL